MEQVYILYICAIFQGQLPKHKSPRRIYLPYKLYETQNTSRSNLGPGDQNLLRLRRRGNRRLCITARYAIGIEFGAVIVG